MIEYEKRAMIEAEDKYTFRQSTQISMQTGLIGHLRADMDTDGNGFFSSWFDFREELKTDEFKAEFDDVINSLREEGDILHNRRALAKYCYCTPQSRMQEEPGYYGVRVDTEKYDTALQLTGFDPVMASIRHYDFADAAKDTPFYKEIIQAMLDYFETEHYVFTHGWIPSIPNRDKSYSYISSWREADREQWNQARWFNGMDAAQTADENKTIVCGHWHTSYGHSKYEHKGTEFGEDADFSPYYGPGIIAIDACTAFSGKVNCLVIED